eukprot:TRINITY_DN42429_c0_g1_i1.p2 TRINITY_DN42429_c0_g1~~TRINITY_DN42429_c0_g1_i1.p2  ORF type:complete len:151 (+),score=29.22 TRINITY_DN42429_c0_g1_i1:69-521(+)
MPRRVQLLVSDEGWLTIVGSDDWQPQDSHVVAGTGDVPWRCQRWQGRAEQNRKGKDSDDELWRRAVEVRLMQAELKLGQYVKLVEHVEKKSQKNDYETLLSDSVQDGQSMPEFSASLGDVFASFERLDSMVCDLGNKIAKLGDMMQNGEN